MQEFRIIPVGGGNPIVVPLPFQNSLLSSIGVNHKLNENWLLRAGFAHARNAVTDNLRNPRVPTGDNNWIALGLQYKLNPATHLNLGYVHQFFKDTHSVIAENNTKSPPAASLQASYRLSMNLITAGIVMGW